MTLAFKNKEDRDLAKIELRPLKTVCDRNPKERVIGVTSERSMRIEHNGQWTEVPKECLSGFSFGVDGLALSGDDTGLGIVLVGKSADKDERVERSIFKLRDGEISCSQVELGPNADNQDHLLRECSRALRKCAGMVSTGRRVPDVHLDLSDAAISRCLTRSRVIALVV